MKKFLLPISLFVLLGSCNVLEKEPLTTIAPSNFFTTAVDAEAALTAVYDGLQQKGAYAEVLPLLANMPTDDCTSLNNDVRNLDVINWNSTTGQIYDAYQAAYSTINRANAVLKYVPGIDMPTTRRDQILGEARFLRALSYLNLVRLYGGVPLRLEPSESGAPAALNLPRATPEQVYEQVIDDLTKAEAQLAAVNPTRATKGAANALLARTYLTVRQWEAARTAAAKVFTSGGTFALAPSFNSLFPADNKTESIFEVQFSGSTDGGTSHTLPDLLLPQPPATYSFQKFNIPTVNLLQAADTVNDQRWSFQGRVNAGRNHASFVQAKSGNENDNGPFTYKWRSDPNGFNSPDNTYILRVADVLLMQAEASNELSGPGDGVLLPLNQVRQRAGLPALSASSPASASKKTMRDEIDRQRRLELAFEGERWFDLLRYARHNQAEAGAHQVTALNLIEQFRGTPDVNYLLLPLPLAELNTNTQLSQNPGY